MTEGYIHGYLARENARLDDQAAALRDLLHHDSNYPEGSRVLEAGCGVGSQTVILATKNPGTHIVALDISAASLEQARKKVRDAGLGNVEFRQGDIYDPPFEPESFDHVLVCFVLEHLSRPSAALLALKALVKPGGTITVIEGDHASAYFYPDDDAARDAIACLVELQRREGGNGNIGRQLYPLLTAAGFVSVEVSPRVLYVDASKPSLVRAFTGQTFTAMVEGIRESAIRNRLIDAERFDAGIRALYRTTDDDGVFCYTFFKAKAMTKRRD